ncbi:hypothetical protein F441_17972 [Phytophthora nicotianae CJ01A1]|uniref:PX domain-containing protein n=5 Tax=Phytophthora nicotianae TaxID=4792 RepID=W2PPT1_PHYN3|nr:hypothetical protein PPTG_16701 [Phytophthora nicotianae INRA-310]ETI35626.1 hypothetical protein F443_18090 [Phytophthora nicotianae P1569]ETK75848.1 hypothetical protein L915_17610 [Phytophthora nicotianae]ETP05412.1 hypothetical protein F441_17972 [Phytophthora nicotianae CJ01A1]ETP33578.1 hypothetical protein F442_17935 [Phytophthora nicotianae P10297]ETL29285.1 hypothetical protein L916_17505 [Phytophthora nicotianae]
MSATYVPSENKLAKLVLHPKLVSPVSSSGDQLTSESVSPASSISVEEVQPHLGLKLEAHRRWNASLPLGFLWSVERVEINVTRTDADNELVFVLEVFLSTPTSRLPVSTPSSSEERAAAACPAFTVEHRFSDFEELRKSVSSCVSMERQCSCMYCLKFVEYIRFSSSQPRGLVKRFAGEQKRKQVLQTFINDFVTMGQRRVRKTGKRKCQAQQLVPNLLSAFLLQGNVH